MLVSELEPKQLRFCQEYIIDLNATKAAIRAGYAPDSASMQGARLIANDKVQEELARLQAKVANKLELTAERVLREAMRVGFSDISEAFDDNGKLKPIKEIPEDCRRAICAVEVEDLKGPANISIGWTRKVKFWDKMKALEKLGDHLKLFAKEINLKGEINVTGLVDEARKRVLGTRALPVIVDEKPADV